MVKSEARMIKGESLGFILRIQTRYQDFFSLKKNAVPQFA